jgi:hypothetical protein
LRLVTIRINSLRFRTQLHDQERSFRSGCLSRRYLSLDSRGRIAFGCTQIVPCLQMLPELRRVAEVPREPQRRIRGYATLAVNDVVDACRRDVNCLGQRVSRHSQRHQKLFAQDFARESDASYSSSCSFLQW